MAVDPLGFKLASIDENQLEAISIIGTNELGPLAWTKDSLKDELKKPYSRLTGVRSMDEGDPDYYGFIHYWILFDEVSLLQIAVSSRARRRGIGGTLLKSMLFEGQKMGSKKAHLEVESDNEAAVLLYRKYGFFDLQMKKNYFSTGKDALVMMAVLDQGDPLKDLS